MTAPRPFTVEGWIDHFRRQQDPPTPEDVSEACLRVGRNAAPALLTYLNMFRLLTPAAASATVGPAWNLAELPQDYLTQQDWRDLFARAGYSRNGQCVGRPSKALRLYRGAPRSLRRRWSWTDDLDVATKFAGGVLGRQPGVVWQADVEPWRLLARNDGRDGRHEEEYVVDTAGLTIVELSSRSVAKPVASGGTDS